MRGLSVVIPTKTLSNFRVCAKSVRQHEPRAQVICVDDGLAARVADYQYVDGAKPFCFSRNVNIGIKAAGDDDVIVLNDDAILKTSGGFSLLQATAEARSEFGIIGATTNLVGNVNQHPKDIGLREDPRMVCFIAVLIPRRTIETVGMLDEEFIGYGFEDDSYCLRTRRAGLKIGIHDGCFVDHASLRSTFRGDPKTPGKLEVGRQIFINKYGSHPL